MKIKKKKTSLIEDFQWIHLILSLKKINLEKKGPPTKSIPILLPFPIYEIDNEFCFISKDPQKKYKEIFQQNNMKAKVIGISKLRNNYKQFEAKRKLCGSYDLFFADKAIIPMLPPLIGKVFFSKKKFPIPINMSKKKYIFSKIEQSFHSTFLHLNNGSNCCLVKIAKSNFPIKHIIQNIEEGLIKIISKIPQNWNNIQSIYIKTDNSIALPIYNSLPDNNLSTTMITNAI
jgi:ribosome biogenesis protein UTP30